MMQSLGSHLLDSMNVMQSSSFWGVGGSWGAERERGLRNCGCACVDARKGR